MAIHPPSDLDSQITTLMLRLEALVAFEIRPEAFRGIFQVNSKRIEETRAAYEAARTAMLEKHQVAIQALREEKEELDIIEAGCCFRLVDNIRSIAHSIFPERVSPPLAARRATIWERVSTLMLLKQTDPEVLKQEWSVSGVLREDERAAFDHYKLAWRDYYQARHGYNPIK